jgi:hypothetical protein
MFISSRRFAPIWRPQVRKVGYFMARGLGSSVSAFSLVFLTAFFVLGCALETADAPEAAQSTESEQETVGVSRDALTPAPSCIKLNQWKTHARVDSAAYATVENHCASTQRVRLIWRWASDGPCTSLERGGSHTEWRSTIGGPDPYITEVRSC